MSVPPPASPVAADLARSFEIPLEAGRSWGRRRGGEDVLLLTPEGALLEHGRALRAPLHLPLGQLRLGLVDAGPARASRAIGRFPVLKRLNATTVIPREHGIEGWLWTSLSGSGLTMLGDPEDAPNAALLLTTSLGEPAIGESFAPEAAAEIAARSPLGAPAVHGLLFRAADVARAESAFRSYGIMRPLTDRDVPPVLRRALPDDRSADPELRASGQARAATSVAPPGMG